jgi:cytidylate kinase/pantoate ligase/cytidylate kinase
MGATRSAVEDVIITIDGPAGAGKSSAARALARRLGFRFLDTGAMYRAVALAALRRGVPSADEAAMAQLARDVSLVLTPDDRLLLDGQDVSDDIRAPEVTAHTRYAADNPAVRRRLVDLQRQAAANGKFVAEGRDQGTVAFPDAACKIYLTASPQVRARRRWAELTARGEEVTFESVLAQQNVRDEQDRLRPFGGLMAAPDAVRVVTDDLDPDQVVERLVALVKERVGG